MSTIIYSTFSHFCRMQPFPKRLLYLYLRIFTWNWDTVNCFLSKVNVINPPPPLCLSLFFSRLPLTLFCLFLYSISISISQTERDRVVRELIRPSEQTGVLTWNARSHTDTSRLTRGIGTLSPSVTPLWTAPAARALANPKETPMKRRDAM